MRRVLSAVLLWGVLAALILVTTAFAQGKWDGSDFAFCYVTDDGTQCNLAWADTARVMDFRFTIAVNARSGVLSPNKLTVQQIHDLAEDGFEIAQHGASHGQNGLPLACSSPPRGSWMGYFRCSEPDESARMAALKADIERDTIATICDIPVSGIRVCAYPQHLHGKALIDTLIAEGFVGARTGGKWDPSGYSYGDFTFMSSNSWDGGISLYRIPTADTDSHFFGNHSATPPNHNSYASFLAIAQPVIDDFRANEGICIIYTHHLGNDNDTYGDINYASGGITKRDLAWLIDLVRANNGKIMTLGDAVAYYRERSHAVDVDGDLIWMPGTTAAGEVRPVALQDLRVHPNPFNPSTVVSFELGARQPVRVAVFDMRGRLVRVLAEGELSAGRQAMAWDGRNGSGLRVASGSYLVQVRTGTTVVSHTAALIK